MSVLFISEATLKSNSLILDNVDTRYIRQAIIDVQEEFLHPLLGTALYRDLKARITAGTVASGSPVYTTLLEDYIQPCLIKWVEAEIQDINTFKIAGKGTVKKDSDNQQPASLDDLARLAQRRRDKAENLAQRLTEYLRANETTYTKYLDQTGQGDDALYPNRTSYQSGIYLDDENCDDCSTRWYERQ